MDADAQREVDRLIHDMLERAGAAIASDAQRFAPRDTGELANSIHAEPVSGQTVKVVADSDHAVYVELGTRYMDAEPYLKPSLYRERAL